MLFRDYLLKPLIKLDNEKSFPGVFSYKIHELKDLIFIHNLSPEPKKLLNIEQAHTKNLLGK